MAFFSNLLVICNDRYVRESELVEQISLASFQNLLLQRSAKPGCNFVFSSHHLGLCYLVHNSSTSGQRRVGKMAWMDRFNGHVSTAGDPCLTRNWHHDSGTATHEQIDIFYHEVFEKVAGEAR